VQPQVGKVGSLDVDRRHQLAAAAGGNGADPRHLLDEGGQVFRLGFGDRVAQL
jgi:hypothetical protein